MDPPSPSPPPPSADASTAGPSAASSSSSSSSSSSTPHSQPSSLTQAPSSEPVPSSSSPVTPSASQASFDDVDDRSRVRFSGAVRRGGWRKVTSVAASRDHSDHSGDEHSRVASSSASSSGRRGKLVMRGSSEAIRTARDTAIRRSSSKSLGEDDVDAHDSELDEDGLRALAADSSGSGSSGMAGYARAALVAPGTIAQLPAIESSSLAEAGANSTAAAAPVAARDAMVTPASEIDWANFVYAYARGKWNPMKPPKPPGRSTVFPGAKTRILMSSSEADEGSSDTGSYVSPSASDAGGRRPSLGYEDLSAPQAAAAAAAAAGPSSSQASPAARRSSLSPLTVTALRPSSPPPVADQDALPSLASVVSRSDEKKLQLQTETAPTPPPVALDPTIFRQPEPALPSTSLQYEGIRSPDATAEVSMAAKADAELIRFATSSLPELHSSVDKLREKEEKRDDAVANAKEAQAEKAKRATHSNSEAVPTVSKAGVRGNDGREGVEQDPTIWAAAARSNISKAPTPSPRANAVNQIQEDIETADNAQRPGPTPVQTSTFFDLPGSRELPTAWQSAPEGHLATARRLASCDSVKDDLVEPDGLAPHIDEMGTVAGLRRAARRSSLLRPDDISSSLSKPIGIHSMSWSSEPGNPSMPGDLASTVPLRKLNSYQLASLVDKPVQSSQVTPVPTSSAPSQPVIAQARTATCSSTQRSTPVSPTRPPLAATASSFASGSDAMAASAPSFQPLACPRPPTLGERTKSTSSSYVSAGRQAEQFFFERGYLPAINPPNEAERKRALARYGPPRITGDPNFDRIGHLVRLVFNSKIVLVSLVGANEQVFQTAVGGGAELSQAVLQQIAGAKHCSFCAHSILQPNDEPLVILDTEKDWRFMGNPLVVGEPHIRFYAGCPLRTTDGLNLGTLCIIDSEPRSEFSPRLRHTLKEFGRVVMRELELTRDRIHLTIRDRMQKSIEFFTRDCLEMATDASHEDEAGEGGDGKNFSSLHALYNTAARNMQSTLKAAGAIIFDLSHFELIESPSSNGQPSKDSKIFYPSPFSAPDVTPYASFDDPTNIQTINSSSGAPDESIKSKDVAPMVVLGSFEDEQPSGDRDAPVPLSHHIKVAQFLRQHRTGCFYANVPTVFRHLLPHGTSSMLLVPIFGLNKQPFALLCAYVKQAADDFEDVRESALQYMRSMGTIILSAVLKKDLMLADQAKSHFISNISHELRTPLHGILASAELLAETKLNTTQGSYLDTVEACGKSLLELVNHVLDFTKLSGGARSKSNAEHKLTQCDLVKLVQEVCESSWIGQTARKLESQQTSGIGSAYAIGASGTAATASTSAVKKMKAGAVETVIDVSMRSKGWLVTCDAGGIRRVLMNLIGNSLKFTTAGFVHVSLREVQSSDTHIVVELSVTDTGRGISREFLEEQLFHPFTQENQLGPGTGLGLSIVNSIVQSPSINGKIDVWSTLGEGTEMRITCEMAVASPEDIDGAVYQPALSLKKTRSVSLVGFDDSRGQVDLRQVLLNYLDSWWDFAPSKSAVDSGDDYSGDIIIVNEETRFLQEIRKRRTPLPPVILLSSALGDSAVAEACEAYHAKGGIARMLFKPAGPAKLEAVVDFCLQCLDRIDGGEPLEEEQTAPGTPLPSPRPSPLHREDMENGDSYFAIGSTADQADTSEDAVEEEEGTPGVGTEAVTPRGPVVDGDSIAPHAPPPRPAFSSALRDSYHISPGPIDQTTTSALVRRHSTEDEIAKRRWGGEPRAKTPLSNVIAGGAADGLVKMPPPTPGAGAGGSRRPLLPPRSITFHQEPSIRGSKNVALSPSLLRNEASGGDYFAAKPLEKPGLDAEARGEGEDDSCDQDGGSTPAAPVVTPTVSTVVKKKKSGPISPGQTVRIDGTEDLILRSAVGTVTPAKLPSSSSTSSGTSKQPRRRIRVLGVDDNEINIKVLRAFMDKFDVDFSAAFNGQECVELFEQTNSPEAVKRGVVPFDIIICDVTMPVLDGYQATAAIRRKEKAYLQAKDVKTTSGEGGQQRGDGLTSSRVKILCLTGRNSEEDKRRAFASGADGFMTRPLSLRVLSSLMRLLTQ